MSAEAPAGLFPRPREFALLDGDGPGRNGAPRFVLDAALPAQGYAIVAERGGIRVAHADVSARRYAEDTLAQLRRAYPDGVPGLRLRDWPDFPVRGLMLDVSRDRVPTRATLEALVERLARLRLNHLELYTEHAFAYSAHERVWRDASPITPDDVRWLDELCAERGIELVANQNCFGHMERWLAHPEYRERAEAPEGWQLPDGRRRPPSVLAPTPGNADFALELVRELMQHFRSRRVNINCDETFELGAGRSRADVEARGRGAVYFEHLQRLLRGLHADGCEVSFWGDILRSHPELAARLPEGAATALVWHYEAPAEPGDYPSEVVAELERFGMPASALRGFRGQVDAFADAGVPFWVCPGTSSWNSLVGRGTNARANLRDAVAVGRERGAGGVLITEWGDNGHLQPPSVAFGPLLDGAGLAWNEALHRDLDLAAGLDAWVFEDRAGVLGRACVEISELYRATGLRGFNASPLHAGLFGGALGAIGTPDASAAASVAEQCAAWIDELARAQPGCSDGEICVRELRQALRLARQGAWRLARRAGAARPDDSALRADLLAAIEEQRSCWLLRARPGGLRDSLARLEALLEGGRDAAA